uniref:F-box/FBD/LRR-repeat protein At1g13570-like n=1 Tax=Erigeron canadensis TaxID=72917 RepID=UPI001CB8FD69|nr:F-box/FBD/LRR-repeat protein At1g13570-like [Erigeron canadensis]
MEVVHRRKASRVSPQVEGEDVMNKIPENVVTNIMDRLPLRDAVRTSILSTNWRFKWTLLTQLIFDANFFHYLFRRKFHFDKTNIIISRLLFHLEGGVTKFSLSIPKDIKVDDEDIHHWVMFLSRLGGFKDLVILNWSETPVKLPTHLFSCLELNRLKLHHCVLFPSYFCGFPKLLSLELLNVRFQGHRCGELIAQCPLLETLKIANTKLRGGMKLVEIAKLENVTFLGLALYLLDDINTFLPENVAQNPVRITFPFLKTLSLFDMDFSSNSMLSCAFGLLFGCRNLQTLHISAIYKNAVPLPLLFSQEVDCSTMGQLQLRNVKLDYIKDLENEVYLMKCMLACSPMLKSLAIRCNSSIESHYKKYELKFELASKLLQLHRASHVAKISVFDYMYS